MGASPPIRFVTTADGVRIAYCCHGDGPPLVFVRGWVHHLELFWEVDAYRTFFEQLASHLMVVRFDARANGQSDRDVERLDLDDFAADVEAVMDGLGLTDVVMWGSCFGGPIAITYAARHPERVARLILDESYATMKDRGTPEEQESFRAMLAALRAQPEAIHAGFVYTRQDREARVPIGDRVERMRRSISAEVLVQLYTLGTELDVSHLLPTLNMPTLVLHRRRTRVIPAQLGRELASLIPGAQFVALEGTASNLWEERPTDALAAIADFLDLDMRFPTNAAAASTPETRTQRDEGVDQLEHVFRQEGEYWTIAYEGDTFRLRDVRGLQFIARLLADPSREFHVRDLEAGDEVAVDRTAAGSAADAGLVGSGDGAIAVLDAAAKAAYKRRLGELAEELEEAEQFNDLERAAQAQAEIDAVVQELSGAVGLGGRDRPTGSATERARVNVTRSIKSAVRRIDGHSHSLAHHLETSVRTGTYCSYNPDPRVPITWEL